MPYAIKRNKEPVPGADLRTDVLILGIGNILLQDEGAGVKAVELLKKEYTLPPGVEILDGGTSGLELLPYLDNRTHLFIIDVLDRENLTPGQVLKIDISGQPGFFRQKISPHQLGLSEVLAAAFLQNMLPEKIILFGIKPKNLGTGLALSPETEEAIGKVIAEIKNELQALNLELTRQDKLSCL